MRSLSFTLDERPKKPVLEMTSGVSNGSCQKSAK